MSTGTTFARIHVVPQLPRFLAEHPDLAIDIILDDRLIDPVAEGIDLLLRMNAPPEPSSMARKLTTGGRSVLATPAYLKRAGEPRSPADLARHEGIVYSQMPQVWSFAHDGVETTVTVQGRLRINAAEGVREAVLAGIGYAVASDWMFAPELESGAVRRLLHPWMLPTVDLWAIFPAGHPVSTKAQAFAAFVAKVLAEGVEHSRSE